MPKKLYGIERLADEASSQLKSALYQRYEHTETSPTLGSPIEALFLLAFEECLYGVWKKDELDVRGFLKADKWVDDIEPGRLHFGLQQEILAGWAVDFALAMRDGEARLRCVVECDGHDFHERTKEQARRDRARDRRLQHAGYKIYRFTGSEIYGDPVRCAKEVYAEIIKFHFSRQV